jgi:hypothetical protein
MEVGETASVDEATGDIDANVDKLLMNGLFNDRVGEIGCLELDDCPGPPGCSPPPSKPPEMEE